MVTAADRRPAERPNAAESLSLAVLLLLERLSPAERAAYVLHEAFDYPFRQVAEVLEISRGERPPARESRAGSTSTASATPS